MDVKGVLLGSQIIGAEMIKNGRGSIINLASIAARNAFPDGAAYGPAKSAVVMITKQCAMEWARHKVRVNAISPGLILTPLSENIYKDEQVKKTREAIIPLGRIGLPEDVAHLAVFLASDESSYITAQDILVDGGITDSVFQKLPGRGHHQGIHLITPKEFGCEDQQSRCNPFWNLPGTEPRALILTKRSLTGFYVGLAVYLGGNKGAA